MNSLLRWSTLFALGGVLLASADARAQVEVKAKPVVDGPFQLAQNPQLEVLKSKDVQKELKLTDEQVNKINALAKKQAEASKDAVGKDLLVKMQEMAENTRKGLAEILDKDQGKRLDQLVIQARGMTALFDPAISGKLNFSPQQMAQMGKAIAEQHKILMDKMLKSKDFKPEQMQMFMGRLQRDVVKELAKLLTPEQMKTWQELAGPPFEGDLPIIGPGQASTGSPPLVPLPIKIDDKQK